MVKVQDAWRSCRDGLAAAGIEDAALEAGWLWQAAVGVDRHMLDRNAPLPPEKAAALEEMTRRRAQRQPLQYILGRWPFMDFEVQVAPGVLIPRQDTECVAETALKMGRALLRRQPAMQDLLWLDVCAGSGVLGIALARGLGLPVTAVELSDAALPILRRNAAAYSTAAAPITVRQADVFGLEKSLAPGSVALLTANPPYLTAQDMTAISLEVAQEPEMALFGGTDGLRFYRHFAAAYRPALAAGGVLVLEIGASQGPAVCGLLRQAGWRDVTVHQDAAGRDRCVTAIR